MKPAVISSALVLAGTMLLSPAAADEGRPEAAEEARHSGTIMRTADDELMLRELVTWTGPGTGVVDRAIIVTPQTAVQLVRRAPWREDNRRARPGWTAIDLRPDDLRPGDFATVTTRDGVDGDVAVSIEIVRPGG